jgi:hypothetical protein
MAVTLEIAYFNSIVIAGGVGAGPTEDTGKWHIEESRIKGEFNGVGMDYGARAHIVSEKYDEYQRPNAMIHSGIFNSRTEFNELNQFPIGEEITRAVDIAQGSIQKLHAEDTNLNIFQENKVNRALIDKDAIYTAEGQSITTSGANIIGQITPYAGKFGISKNPESFAVFGNRKYFADQYRGVVCRLSQDGITPISVYGMKDFFKDHLVLCDNIYGSFDEQKQKYFISLQGSTIDGGILSKASGNSPEIDTAVTEYRTLAFDENVQGWVSFYTFKPTFGVSLHNEYYTWPNKTLIGQNMFKHYDTTIPRAKFYEEPDGVLDGAVSFPDPVYIKTILNDKPDLIKNFLTINYEGTTGWTMESFNTGGYAITGYDTYDNVNDAYKIPKESTSIDGETIGFVKKEGKYFSELRNKAVDMFQDNTYFNTTGLKGYYGEFEFRYWEPTEGATAKKAELFGGSSEVILSSK